MKLVKVIGLWIVTCFFVIIALGSLPSFACFTSIIVTLLLAPINKWQNFLCRFVKGKLKTIAIIVLVIATLFTLPRTDAPVSIDSPGKTSSISTNESATNSTVPSTTQHTSVPTIPPTTTPTINPPHIHSFNNATCTNPKTCSCGATEGIPNGHDWQNATCSEPKTCAVCGATNGLTLGHNFSDGECTICGKADPNYERETMVWIPKKGGTKYHSHSGCSNMDNPEQVTQSEAESRGFTRCKKCY